VCVQCLSWRPRFTLGNKNQVQMDYNWQVIMENFTPTMQRAVTFLSEAERAESRMDVVDTSYVPFTIQPEYGTIMPGKKTTFTVRFSPLDVNEYEGRLICT
jgi:hydrocephalus-inducing protein